MRLYSKALLVTGVVGLVMAWGFASWRARSTQASGEQALSQLDDFEKSGLPDFSFNDASGVARRLGEFKGKIVIVNFWASWCGPCLEEMPSLISLIESQGGRVQLLAVSADNSREDLDSFLKAFPKVLNPNIHIIWDEDHSIAKKFSVDRLPESFIAGTDLRMVKKIIGTIDWHTPESATFMESLGSK